MSARDELEEVLRELAQGAGPVMERVAQMNAGVLDDPNLDERSALMARFGALVALDASPASYLVHLTFAEKAGITPRTMEALFASLAPLVGSARIISAAESARQAIALADLA